MTTLRELLTKELIWCIKHRAETRTVRLSKGLVLQLYVDQAGENHLLAGRLPPAVPSEGEIQTVLRAWPQQPTPILPWEVVKDTEDPISLGKIVEIPPPVVNRGTRTIGDLKYNSLSFHWRPLTPQPFAGKDEGYVWS